MDRRTFLSGTSTALGLAAASVSSTLIQPRLAKAAPNDRVVVAVAGVRGRGSSLLNTFAGLPTCEVKYVCDLDASVLAERVAGVESSTGRRPEAIKDFRRALDDKRVDAIVLGTPDHWHAIPTIMACQAGKDVYVEKPDGHNIIEGRTMVAAAKKHGRVVQLGTQSRSSPHFHAAMEYLRAGNIGRPLFAKAWESAQQGSIGHPPDGEPPAGVDYDLWLGPAPKRAFNPNRFHGNWRWFFDYGTGDLGNDGVHRLDVARWGLETAIAAAGEAPLPLFPTKTTAVGGKYYFDDDQEWPDTLMVTWDYPGRVLTYEMRLWSRYPLYGDPEGAAVYGDRGYVVIGNRRWRAFGLKDELLREEKGEQNEIGHAQNFIDCMHSRGRPVADLETVGHPSSALCHLGNIAWRVGRTVKFDPATYTFPGDDEANRYLTRAEYRAPWTLPTLDNV
ncbi:MAG: Gfo/Idh/MocA family oxidoreductase [Pirellulales bacterium]|nr:Gfo/Idh/MocA family oxidoreductase [Pirellulales bacterium]